MIAFVAAPRRIWWWWWFALWIALSAAVLSPLQRIHVVGVQHCLSVAWIRHRRSWCLFATVGRRYLSSQRMVGVGRGPYLQPCLAYSHPVDQAKCFFYLLRTNCASSVPTHLRFPHRGPLAIAHRSSCYYSGFRSEWNSPSSYPQLPCP